MKKLYTLLATALVTTALFAQTSFTDDFEGYTAGDLIGQQPGWGLWNNDNGNDMGVSDVRAFSGTNALHFNSEDADNYGGVILMEMSSAYDQGTATTSFKMYVESGTGAFFSSRTLDATSGGADFVTFNDDGSLSIQDGSGAVVATGTYPQGQWFDYSVSADIIGQQWKYSIAGVETTIANTAPSVGSVVFAITGSNSDGSDAVQSFHIDDVSWNLVDFEFPPLDLAILSQNQNVALVNQRVRPEITIQNRGENDIISFDVIASYNGLEASLNLTNLSLEKLETMVVDLGQYFVAQSGSNDLQIRVTNINDGAQDVDETNNVIVETIENLITPTVGKIVIAEEATGTWCQFCPRGHVVLERMAENYSDYFQGIAVHNRDPMVVSEYDTWLGQRIGGYPSGLSNRGVEADPIEFEAQFLQQITGSYSVQVNEALSFDENTRELSVSGNVKAIADLDGPWRMFAVVIENHVVRDANGYAQVNAYAGGGLGAMGGYENLPNPVPAADMVYNEVARAISDPNGEVFATDATTDQEFPISYSFTLAQDWNPDEVSIVIGIVRPDGSIDNGGVSHITEKVDDEVAATDEEGTYDANTSSIRVVDVLKESLEVYPNPSTNGTAFVKTTFDNAGLVSMNVVNINGQTVLSRNYGEVAAGEWNFPIKTNDLSTGLYVIELTHNNTVYTSKLSVK